MDIPCFLSIVAYLAHLKCPVEGMMKLVLCFKSNVKPTKIMIGQFNSLNISKKL